MRAEIKWPNYFFGRALQRGHTAKICCSPATKKFVAALQPFLVARGFF